MASTVSWDKLRELAGFRAERGCAISLYLGLDPSVAPTAVDAESRVRSLLAEGERVATASRDGLTHGQREGLKADLERIRRWFDNDFDRAGSRGFAIFAAGLDNAWTTLALMDPVEDELRIGREFYLAPLVPLVGRGSGATSTPPAGAAWRGSPATARSSRDGMTRAAGRRRTTSATSTSSPPS